MAIRIVIADDHEVLRRGLMSLFAGSEIEIAAQAESGNEAVRLTTQESPDVVLLDIRMKDGDGLSALERIKASAPHLPVLVLSTYNNPTYIGRAMALGASGYLLKGSSQEEIVAKIRAVAAGETVWTSDELRRFGRNRSKWQRNGDLEVTLTRREHEVLVQVAHGLTNKQIGQRLHISAETVKEHIQNVLRKIGVSDRTQAAVWAARHGLC